MRSLRGAMWLAVLLAGLLVVASPCPIPSDRRAPRRLCRQGHHDVGGRPLRRCDRCRSWAASWWRTARSPATWGRSRRSPKRPSAAGSRPSPPCQPPDERADVVGAELGDLIDQALADVRDRRATASARSASSLGRRIPVATGVVIEPSAGQSDKMPGAGSERDGRSVLAPS